VAHNHNLTIPLSPIFELGYGGKMVKENINVKEVWKEFFKLKILEVVITLSAIFIPWYIGYRIFPNLKGVSDFFICFDPNPMCEPTRHWFDNIGNWFVGAFWVGLVIAVIGLIIMWIMNNWETAKDNVKSRNKPNSKT